MELLLILIVGGIVASYACGLGRTFGHRIGRSFERQAQRLAAERRRREN